eukprot:9487199-Pyramimonas_sp.AAC.1
MIVDNLLAMVDQATNVASSVNITDQSVLADPLWASSQDQMQKMSATEHHEVQRVVGQQCLPKRA